MVGGAMTALFAQKMKSIPGLDAGIAQYVEILRRYGVETYQSCEGWGDLTQHGDEHSFPEPTIQFHGGPEGGAYAYAIARVFGLPVKEIRRCWDEQDGELTGPHWEIVFWRKATDERVNVQSLAEIEALA